VFGVGHWPMRTQNPRARTHPALPAPHTHSPNAPTQNPYISTQRPRAPDNKGTPDPDTNELSCMLYELI
jgi:hypothetical protein